MVMAYERGRKRERERGDDLSERGTRRPDRTGPRIAETGDGPSSVDKRGKMEEEWK